MKISSFLPLFFLEQFEVPIGYMAVAGAGAGAEIMVKVGAGAEKK